MTMTLSVEYVTARRDMLWSRCTDIATEIDRLTAVRASGGISLAAVNAAIESEQTRLTAAITDYYRAA